MSKAPSQQARRLRPALSLGKYAKLFAFWNCAGWTFLLWVFSRVVFHWLNVDGAIGRGWGTFYTAWAGFFVGAVVFCSATLQSRRILVLGWLVPTESEWNWMDRTREKTLGGSFWVPAFGSGLLFAALLGGACFLSGQFKAEPALSRMPFLFYTTLLPGLCVMPLTWLVARGAVRRFVLARKHPRPLLVPRWHYVFVHNLAPYVLLSSGVGLVVAFARFWPLYQEGTPVPIREFNLHLSATAFGIALFVVAAARFKTRVDALGPLTLEGVRPRGFPLKWSFWYSLLISTVIFLLLWTGFAIAGVEGVDAATATGVKVATCLLVSATTAYWGVTSALRELSGVEPDAHPYMKWSRQKKEAELLQEDVDFFD